jgi:hypothetical protein
VTESILSVTGQADDLTLLTEVELRVAVGIDIGDASQDDALKILGGRVAARVATACRIRADGAKPPTLRQENLVETFRLGDDLGRWRGGEHHASLVAMSELVLARRPIVSIAEISEDGVDLVQGTDYEIVADAGMVRRLWFDQPSPWRLGKIIVTYTAGWDTVPEGLKFGAAELARTYWYQSERDPAVRQVNIPGVISRSYFGAGAADPDIPLAVADALRPYINEAIA